MKSHQSINSTCKAPISHRFPTAASLQYRHSLSKSRCTIEAQDELISAPNEKMGVFGVRAERVVEKDARGRKETVLLEIWTLPLRMRSLECRDDVIGRWGIKINNLKCCNTCFC